MLDSLLTKTKHYAHETFKAAAETVMPTLKESKFFEKGVLTPEEYVEAGDMLVHNCSTWSWESGEKTRMATFLPKEKQFLISRSVPCLKRVRAFELQDAKEEVTETGWLNTHVGVKSLSIDSIEEIKEIDEKSDEANESKEPLIKITEQHFTNGDNSKVVQNNEGDGLDNSLDANGQKGADIPDIDCFEESDNIEEIDEIDDDVISKPNQLPYIKAKEPADDGILKTRTYDLTITYDKYYQVPRIWLRGYDENSRPLTSAQIMEDISVDHAEKTVTVESHPHTGSICASIHPCKHADLMKILIERMQMSKKEMRPDQYLFLFLKFMSSVIPTIEYDFTTQAG